MKKHCVKKFQNLVGRLEAAWALALQGFYGFLEHGLLKSMFFANADWLREKPCFLLNLVTTNREMKFMMRLILGFVIIFLVGCQSEVDKCLDVEMAGWVAKQERVTKENAVIVNERNRLLSLKNNDNKDKVDYFPNLTTNMIDALQEIKKDERGKDEVIADLRLTCMKAASKK
jgi:hypothetical protein